MGAFALLIFYHIMLVFAPWDWHVNSHHRFEWLEWGALVTNPWRLTLLFLVSGAAVRLMSRRRTVKAVALGRLARLGPPLLFGILVIVPPQAYFEAITKFGFEGGFLSYWSEYLSPRRLLERPLPVNHLWFVLYILVYSLAAVVMLARPTWIAALEALMERWLVGWRLLLIPIAWLFLTRVALYPLFGLSNQLHDDWYNHCISLGAFLLGFVAAGSDTLWDRLAAGRRLSLIVALAGLAALVGLEVVTTVAWANWPQRSLAYAVNQWATMAAILGYGRQYLARRDGPVLRYLTEAIFPCYLVHQTVIVIAAYQIKPLGLPAATEALMLVGLTLAACLLAYEIAKRSGPLAPLMGLKWKRRQRST